MRIPQWDWEMVVDCQALPIKRTVTVCDQTRSDADLLKDRSRKWFNVNIRVAVRANISGKLPYNSNERNTENLNDKSSQLV